MDDPCILESFFIIVYTRNKINTNLTYNQFLYSYKSRKKRRIINNNQFGHPTRWPSAIIPFEFDTDASKDCFNIIVTNQKIKKEHKKGPSLFLFINNKNYFWLDSNLIAETLKRKFFTAVNLWHQSTCIRFEPYSPLKHPRHRSKVLIRNRGQYV